jgi:GDP-L-fucose synthase
MKKLLLTGGTGFIGRNILPRLEKYFEVCAPTRQELDLKDSDAVERYVKDGHFDIIMQGANPNPVKNAACDHADTMFEDSMRIFMNFYNVRQYCGKLFYFGSGAEYNKQMEIKEILEEDAQRSIPKDSYGLAKFYMNELARNSENVYNLRIFGCYGPYDHESKFLTHVIRCCLAGKDITMRQNCVFDYTQVFDLAEVINLMANTELKYHDYNVCTGKPISLLEIAEKIQKEMKANNRIIVENPGLNREYTGSNKRLLDEFGDSLHFTSIEDGIKIQIEHEKKVMQ